MAVTGVTSGTSATYATNAMSNKKETRTIRGNISDESKKRVHELADNPKNVKRMKSQQLDKDAFFKLMLEQLKNQDPMSPMDNNDMLNQMSQLSSMEQLENMTKMQAEATRASKDISDQVKALTQAIVSSTDSREMLQEIQKINQKLSTYIAATTKPDAGDVASALGDETGKQNTAGVSATDGVSGREVVEDSEITESGSGTSGEA